MLRQNYLHQLTDVKRWTPLLSEFSTLIGHGAERDGDTKVG